MTRQLAGHVSVRDDEGVRHTFAPGDDLPGWAEKKITSLGAWVEEPDAVAPTEPSSDADSSPRTSRKSTKTAPRPSS